MTILLGAAALAACAPKPGQAGLQAKVDQAIAECSYHGAMTFRAISDRVVELGSTSVRSEPDAAESGAFSCVLAKIGQIRGVSLGFVGNGPATESESQ